MKLYLAGPDVFFRDAMETGRRKREVCARHGIEGLYPLDVDINAAAPGAAARIFHANVQMIESADAVVANLTPFRSVSADVGAAFELGMGFALGKPVHGYSNVGASMFDRAVAGVPRDTLAAAPDGRPLHPDGMAVEDFGLADNLMLIEAIRASGGCFVGPKAGETLPNDNLTLFETCVAAIAGADDATKRPG